MRVLFFSTFFEINGNPTYYTEEIISLTKNYPELEFIVYNIASERNRKTKYSDRILWLERKNLKNIRTLIIFLRDIVKIFTKFKPDIIHSVYVVESIIMGFVGKIFRVPSIFHSRGKDLNYYSFVSLKKNILSRIAGMINNIILTVSEDMKKNCIKLNISKEKIIKIYDGIDYSLFKLDKKRNLFLNNKIIEILNIGRFSFEKCHEIIINVCKELKQANYDIHLTLIGEGVLKDKIKQLIKEYKLENEVELIKGWVPHYEIPKYMIKADLYIQPSLTEGMPISVLEAMSMELPIIMTKVGGMSELNVPNGVILIDKNNSNQLFEAIVHYIENPQERILGGKKNREFARNTFNWISHAEKLYYIYNHLI